MAESIRAAAASDLGLTRAGIMEAARTQSFAPSMFLDGVTFEMTPDSALGITSMQPMVWDAAAEYFNEEGGEVVSLSD